ncbi:MAG TPA: hypothetical protein PKD76_09150 [Solirubrobacterales bacterium]|nr:hypothetical protein [Solirubrobacterales bacterium]
MTINLPHVPLEAGAGPDNPPCPACSEPLFPWVGMPVGTGIAHRCEACGLGVLSFGERFHFPARAGEAEKEGASPGSSTRLSTSETGEFLFDPGTAGDALAELDSDRDADGSYLFDNRSSLNCWLTGGAWTGLGTERRYRFTPESVVRLIAVRDQIVSATGWRPLRGIATMWQSGLNLFTFGQNVALGAFGKAHGVTADRRWKRGLDWFISVVVAVPAFIVAVPLELIGILFRRGGSARVRIQAL